MSVIFMVLVLVVTVSRSVPIIIVISGLLLWHTTTSGLITAHATASRLVAHTGLITGHA